MVRHPRDLAVTPFPELGPDAWADPQKLLRSLHEHALKKAEDTVEWYLRRKRPKKLWSRALRATAIVSAGVGGVVPLAHVTLSGIPIELGYVSFAIAALCLGFDHYFGLSSGWMRDMASTLAILHKIDSFQYEWIIASSPSGTAEAQSANVQNRLSILVRFSDEIADLVAAETNDWKNEFETNLSVLRGSSSSSTLTAPEAASRRLSPTSESQPSA